MTSTVLQTTATKSHSPANPGFPFTAVVGAESMQLALILNAGTVALQYFFSQYLNRPAWDKAVSEAGFEATYRALFGDPFARALDARPRARESPSRSGEWCGRGDGYGV